MKKILLSIMLASCVCSMQAQTKKWEHNILASAGLLIDHTDGTTDEGLSLKLGYGLNHYFSDTFSLMPCIALRQETVGLTSSKEGADDDAFLFLDVPVVAQFHLTADNSKWVLGLGPVLSFCLQNDTYYIDANPGSPLNGKDKIKTFGLSLQPSVMYETGHFRIGMEGTIGLTDIKENHGLTSGSKHLHNIMATIGYHF